jgi:hypothetical protein
MYLSRSRFSDSKESQQMLGELVEGLRLVELEEDP